MSTKSDTINTKGTKTSFDLILQRIVIMYCYKIERTSVVMYKYEKIKFV